MADVCVYKVSQRTLVAVLKHNESLGFRTSNVGIPVILKMSPVLKCKLKTITLIIQPIINFQRTCRVIKSVTSGIYLIFSDEINPLAPELLFFFYFRTFCI